MQIPASVQTHRVGLPGEALDVILRQAPQLVWTFPPGATFAGGQGKLFHKGPDSKHFQLCGPHSLLQLLSSVATVQKQPQTLCKQVSMAWLSSNKTSFTKIGVKVALACGPLFTGLSSRLSDQLLIATVLLLLFKSLIILFIFIF